MHSKKLDFSVLNKIPRPLKTIFTAAAFIGVNQIYVQHTEKSLLARDGDKFATVEYTKTLQNDPSFKDYKFSVGHTRSDGLGSEGSMTLLDNEGTVVLSAHQVKKSREVFVDFNDEVSGKIQMVSALVDVSYVNRKKDIAFGTITNINSYGRADHIRVADKPFTAMQESGLIPVEWDDATKKGSKVTLVGYAKAMFIHAASGNVQGTVPYYPVVLPVPSIKQCSTAVNAWGIGGMSGGAAIHNGKYAGTFSAASMVHIPPGGSLSLFTPAEAVRNDYVKLFPDRARRAGVTAPDEASLPPECRFNAKDFSVKNLEAVPD